MEMDKREYIEYIGRKHLYMKKFHYDKNTYDEAMIDDALARFDKVFANISVVE